MRAKKSVKSETSSQINRKVFRRTVFLMGFFGVVLFVVLFVRLFDIAIIHHDEYKGKALSQQTTDASVSANRGTIYDANGNVLAISETVYTLILSPADIVASIDERDYETNAEYQAAINAKKELILNGLLRLTDLDKADLEERLSDDESAYEVLKKNIQDEDAKPLREFMEENSLGYELYFSASTSRYYPYSNLACQVVGFTNANGGAYGIEQQYNELLEGTVGRVVTSVNPAGNDNENTNSEYVKAENGKNLYLSIDTTIQQYATEILAESIEKNDIQYGGICIVMDPNTGAVLADVSLPDYDCNDPTKVYSSLLSEPLEELKEDLQKQADYEAAVASSEEEESDAEESNEEDADASTDESKDEEEKIITAPLKKNVEESDEYLDALAEAQYAQWRNKSINDTYEPGSTFKPIVVAAALQEGVANENTTFDCVGFLEVNDTKINCDYEWGHGTQNLTLAVMNSCNPAFMRLGFNLGANRFYDYFEEFGLTTDTGLDIPGEQSGTVWTRDYLDSSVGLMSLATASFGQRFTVTPMQMLTALCACINGGYLLQPYFVGAVEDADGTVDYTDRTVIRQVVSEKVSDRVCAILEKVVSEGTGSKAYVSGCRIGGKTGTAETTDENRYIVSFVGFAPADNPQVAVLLALDGPEFLPGSKKYTVSGRAVTGGSMAAPEVGKLIEKIFDYKGIEKTFTADEVEKTFMVKNFVGDTPKNAEIWLSDYQAKVKVIGNGENVTAQVPAVWGEVPVDSTVYLYCGEDVPETAKVPDVAGLTLGQARSLFAERGLYLEARGAENYGGSTIAVRQDVAPGTEVNYGTIIGVTFYEE